MLLLRYLADHAGLPVEAVVVALVASVVLLVLAVLLHETRWYYAAARRRIAELSEDLDRRNSLVEPKRRLAHQLAHNGFGLATMIGRCRRAAERLHEKSPEDFSSLDLDLALTLEALDEGLRFLQERSLSAGLLPPDLAFPAHCLIRLERPVVDPYQSLQAKFHFAPVDI